MFNAFNGDMGVELYGGLEGDIIEPPPSSINSTLIT